MKQLNWAARVFGHESRIHLTAICAHAEILLQERQGALNNKQKHSVSSLLKSLHRLEKECYTFLDTAFELSRQVKAESGRQ